MTLRQIVACVLVTFGPTHPAKKNNARDSRASCIVLVTFGPTHPIKKKKKKNPTTISCRVLQTILFKR